MPRNIISRGFHRLLVLLEEHAVGILVTIIVHLLIISVALVWRIGTYTEDEQSVLIDFSQFKPDEESPAPETQQETAQDFIQKLNETHNIRNIPVNTAERRAEASIDKMVRDIKTEMNITDPPTPSEEPTEDAEEEAQRKYDAKFPENSQGERTVYKGNTTVSYDLADRRHLFMPVPAFKCENAGTVVVKIIVNPRGYVVKAGVDETTSSNDRCLCEAALADAKRSRFNDSNTAPAKQEGSITYTFLAQ